MPISDLTERRRIAATVRSLRGIVAEEVTNQFLVRHPAWLERYGDRARRFGIEDAGYHVDFLAGAIESGEIEAFNEYCEWAARMLASRHIEAAFLAENLEQIGEALRRQLLASDADFVSAFIRSGAERCLRAGTDGGAMPAGPLGSLTRLYTEAALGGSRQVALNLVLEAVRQGESVIDIYADVLQGAMYRIGRLWEANQITVAKEHMATAITQFVIAQLYPLIEVARKARGKIVLTGVQGELHQVGANMVADVLEASGWDVRFLGTNTPARGVLDAIEQHRAGILGISATMLFNVPNVARLAETVRAKLGERVRIVVGGAAFRSAPALCAEIGAMGCAFDLRSAIRMMDDLAAGAGHRI
jgi:methanogenic corrinoid protein MtbC1